MTKGDKSKTKDSKKVDLRMSGLLLMIEFVVPWKIIEI